MLPYNNDVCICRSVLVWSIYYSLTRHAVSLDVYTAGLDVFMAEVAMSYVLSFGRLAHLVEWQTGDRKVPSSSQVFGKCFSDRVVLEQGD